MPLKVRMALHLFGGTVKDEVYTPPSSFRSPAIVRNVPLLPVARLKFKLSDRSSDAIGLNIDRV